ncbi:oligosaccharide flippase family protein [Chlamydiota bacterium]
MNLKAVVIRNIFVRWGVYGIAGVISFFMLPFVIRYVGDSYYGIWILINSLTGYLGLLDFGIGTSVVKYVSQFHSQAEKNNLEKIINSVLFLYALIGLVCLLITFLFVIFIPRFFTVDSMSVSTIRLLVLLVGLQVSLSFPFGVFGGVLKGYHKYDIDSYISIVVIGLRTFFIVLFLRMGYGIVMLAIISLLSSFVGHFLRLLFGMRYLREIRIRITLLTKECFHMIFKYSFLVFISGISKRIVRYTDSIIIGLFMPASAITYYLIGWRLLEYIREFVLLMTNTFIPVASHYSADESPERNHKLLLEGSKLSWIIILFFGGILITKGSDVIRLWVGVKYVAVAYPILVIHTISDFFAIPQFTAGSILYGIAKHKIVAIFSLIRALANLILSLILINYFGLIGVALGTAIPSIIINTFFMPFFACKYLQLSVGKYLKNVFFLPLIGAVPFFIYCFYISNNIVNNLFELLLVVIMGFIVFFIGIYFVNYNKLLFKKNVNEA